ncbi:hypothetical protein CEXT_22461 [Caerostris extrusa]|uniref:Uncharacterized protein n=1 Tax=Caerostris extrusa TaxID=172846 RepID=A0AAV4VKB4_CAEEX|nr:hypothetical protein CEXT_22461 [Caerostris extrusa]
MQRKDEICISWRTGIVGHEAKYRESLNMYDCYKLYSRYLQICGIGFHNAAFCERSALKYNRNQVFTKLCGLPTQMYKRAMDAFAK